MLVEKNAFIIKINITLLEMINFGFSIPYFNYVRGILAETRDVFINILCLLYI